LAKKPDSGKTVVWMTCQLSACATIGDQIKSALDVVGWNYKSITYDQADPSSLVSGLQQALQFKPSYVLLSGVAEQQWQSVLPAYKSAGVKIIASFLGDTQFTDTLIANIAGPPLDQLQGEELAQWFIADSNGQGNVLLQTVNDYPSNKILAETFSSTVAKNCPKCHVDTINVGLADAGSGQAPTQVVSALRTHPNDTYFVGTYGPFLDSLPSALGAASLSGKIKVAVGFADAGVIAAVKSGQFRASTANSAVINSYLMVDAALRDETGTPQPTNSSGAQLVTSSVNIPAGDYNQPTDSFEQFKKLWGAS
jgi:ribose transport system substrate-binding protein